MESVESNVDKTSPCGFAQSVLINLPNSPSTDKLLDETSNLTNVKFIGQKEYVLCVLPRVWGISIGNKNI